MDYEEAKKLVKEELTDLVIQYRVLRQDHDEAEAATWIGGMIGDNEGPFKKHGQMGLAALIAIAVVKLSDQEAELAQWRSVAGTVVSDNG